MTEGLTGTTIHSAKWTYLSTLITAGLQVVVTAVLARLLLPAAFGLVAMSALVLRFGQYFAQMGVGQALVQRRQLDDAHIAAAFWLSLVVGSLSTVGAWLLAPIAAATLDTVALIPVLRWMSLSFVIAGSSATSFAILRRAMRFRAVALIEIVAYGIGYGGALALALNGAGVWALVFAGLCQAGVASICYNVMARSIRFPVRRWQPYRDLLGFGSTVSVVSFLEFLTANLDTIVVGKFEGPSQLGFYTRALSLTSLPMQYMSTSLSRVLLPSFSRIQSDTIRVGRAYVSLITVFSGIGLPIALGMSGASREIVGVMLGPHWAQSIPVMRIVAFASVAGMLAHFGGVTMEAMARLREKFILNLAQLGLFALLIVLLAPLGLVGYAAAFAISQVAFLVAQTFVLSRVVRIDGARLFGAYSPGLVGGLLSGTALYCESMAGQLLGLTPVFTLAIQMVTGFLILVLVGLLYRNGQLYRVLRDRLGEDVPSRLRGPIATADRIVGIVALREEV